MPGIFLDLRLLQRGQKPVARLLEGFTAADRGGNTGAVLDALPSPRSCSIAATATESNGSVREYPFLVLER